MNARLTYAVVGAVLLIGIVIAVYLLTGQPEAPADRQVAESSDPAGGADARPGQDPEIPQAAESGAAATDAAATDAGATGAAATESAANAAAGDGTDGAAVALSPEVTAALRAAPAQDAGASGTPEVAGPAFDVVRIGREGDAVIAGRADPNTEIVVRSGDEELGRVRTGATGDWVLQPESPVSPGEHRLSAIQLDAENVETESEHVVVVVVPERGRDLAGRVSAAGNEALSVLVPREGPGPTRVLQVPESGTGVVPDVTVDVIDYGEDGRLRLAGRALAGSAVIAYLDSEALGRGRAAANGTWDMSPDRRVAPGLYTLRVDLLDDAGAVAARVELPFMRAEPLDDLPAEALVVVQPGNSLWRIARRLYGHGLQYTHIYDANANQIRDPDLIYPGQIFALPEIH